VSADSPGSGIEELTLGKAMIGTTRQSWIAIIGRSPCRCILEFKPRVSGLLPLLLRCSPTWNWQRDAPGSRPTFGAETTFTMTDADVLIGGPGAGRFQWNVYDRAVSFSDGLLLVRKRTGLLPPLVR
jgi:hypothetical protein